MKQPFWEWCLDRGGGAVCRWLWAARHWLVWIGAFACLDWAIVRFVDPHVGVLFAALVFVGTVVWPAVALAFEPPSVTIHRWLCAGHDSLRARWRAECGEGVDG